MMTWVNSPLGSMVGIPPLNTHSSFMPERRRRGCAPSGARPRGMAEDEMIVDLFFLSSSRVTSSSYFWIKLSRVERDGSFSRRTAFPFALARFFPRLPGLSSWPFISYFVQPTVPKNVADYTCFYFSLSLSLARLLFCCLVVHFGLIYLLPGSVRLTTRALLARSPEFIFLPGRSFQDDLQQHWQNPTGDQKEAACIEMNAAKFSHPTIFVLST